MGSHVYSHYGLPYAYYGKRSADAEPEADAEADPLSSTAITDILTLMVMDTDMLDSHTLTTHTPTMERDLLMLSQRPRLMLTHISSMVDTTDLTLIMPVTSHTPMDTHTPMDFGERSKSKLSDSLLK